MSRTRQPDPVDGVVPGVPALEQAAGSRLSVAGLVTALAGVAVVVSIVSLVDRPDLEQHEVQLLVVLLVLMGVGQFFRLQLPGQRDSAPVGAAMALAMAMVPQVGGTAVDYPPAVVVVATLVGTLVGIVPHALVGRAPTSDTIAREVLVVGAAALLFRSVPWPGLGVPATELAGAGHPGSLVAAAMLVVAAVATGLNVLVAALVRAGRFGTPLRTAVRDELGAGLGVTAAVGITGILVALAARPMDLLAVPVFAVPLLVTQFAFRRYAAVRTTYRQTLRSLARLSELAGYTQSLHSARVATLSVAVGQRLGLGERDLVDLEYAAQLHDIGQLSLPVPLVGGATSRLAAGEARRIAADGAEVVRQGEVVGRVAEIVELQAHPYRRPGVDGPAGDRSVPLASRVLRAVNAYDDMVGESTDGTIRQRALEHLRLGVAEDYDPVVVSALTAVLDRSFGRGAIGAWQSR